MFWKVLVAIVALIGALLWYAASKPDEFVVARTISINASPEVVFAQLNDFKHWKDWSAWEKKDPNLQRTFSGSASGLGSIYIWNGNDEVGQGQMEIITSEAPHKLVVNLDFVKPFETRNVTEFTLKNSGSTTDVTWELRGPQVYLGKLMGVFVDMDQMIGKDFEAGLATLKTLAEQQPKAQPVQESVSQNVPSSQEQSSLEQPQLQ